MKTKVHKMVKEAGVDIGYEFYQTIIDFDHPIQIFREALQNSIDEGATKVFCNVYTEKSLGKEDLFIEIWDNGTGLKKDNVDCFFGLAKSTKVDRNKAPLKGKLGYKGHGTKIFFKSERVEICSKTPNGQTWGVLLDDAIGQIRKSGKLCYSDFLREQDLSIKFPKQFKSGFYIKIKNPAYFGTTYTRFMLNHIYLRDYIKWYTVFGNIRSEFEKITSKNLYLRGLSIDFFSTSYNNFKLIDPPAIFEKIDNIDFENISMGHYFPPERSVDRTMLKYSKNVGENKAFSTYYSKRVFSGRVYLDNNISFDFILHTEGYETKRRYDILLSRRGSYSIDKNLIHTDAERYGLWACKGGVPIEKIDDWIEGGRGVGTYTYMHAFVDCDSFELTGTRGSIRNTNLEILEKIKQKVNEILSDNKIKNVLEERQSWEDFEKTIRSIESDKNELKNRFHGAQNKNQILLPKNNAILYEPRRLKNGYSESETLVLLIQLMTLFPALFPFKLLDYNTKEGIDFVVKKGEYPVYIELKGSMQIKINHSFRNIYKFICYDIDLNEGDVLTDVEDLSVKLTVNKTDKFESFDNRYKAKSFTSYQLQPLQSIIQSMEVIVLKKILIEVLGAKIS